MDWLVLLTVIIAVRILIPTFWSRTAKLSDKLFDKVEKMLDE